MYIYTIMRHTKPINTTISNITKASLLANLVAITSVYILYFDLRYKILADSISQLITRAPIHYQVMVPSFVIVASFVVEMYELVYFVIKNDKTAVDVALIYIASFMCLAQILLMSITLDESYTSHQLYASVFFVSVYVYALVSIFESRKYLNVSSPESLESVFADKYYIKLAFGLKILIFILLMVGLGVFIINQFTSVFANTVLSGFSYTVFELYVVTFGVLIIALNYITGLSFRPIHLEYIVTESL